MKPLTVKIPAELADRLVATCAIEQVSPEELVRRALANYLATAPLKSGSLGQLAGDLVGCCVGAPADLASNPRYLNEFGGV